MKFIRAFIAGIALPSTVLPIGLSVFEANGRADVLAIQFVHFVPLFWGIWNILYFASFKEFLPKNRTVRLMITGAVLGLILALYGVFSANIPEAIGIPEDFHYLPLLVIPILYAILWGYIVRPINSLLGLTDN